MDLGYPLCNLGYYGETIVSAAASGGMEAYIKEIEDKNFLLGFNSGYDCGWNDVFYVAFDAGVNEGFKKGIETGIKSGLETGYKNGYKAGSIKTGIIIGAIGLVTAAGAAIATALIIKHKNNKKAKLQAVN